jgi:hypothetical protein
MFGKIVDRKMVELEKKRRTKAEVSIFDFLKFLKDKYNGINGCAIKEFDETVGNHDEKNIVYDYSRMKVNTVYMEESDKELARIGKKLELVIKINYAPEDSEQIFPVSEILVEFIRQIKKEINSKSIIKIKKRIAYNVLNEYLYTIFKEKEDVVMLLGILNIVTKTDREDIIKSTIEFAEKIEKTIRGILQDTEHEETAFYESNLHAVIFYRSYYYFLLKKYKDASNMLLPIKLAKTFKINEDLLFVSYQSEDSSLMTLQDMYYKYYQMQYGFTVPVEIKDGG